MQAKNIGETLDIKDWTEDFNWIPIEHFQSPPNGRIDHMKDYYWPVKNIDGVECIPFLKKKPHAPLANQYEEITTKILKHFPGAVIRLIPSVFMKERFCD